MGAGEIRKNDIGTIFYGTILDQDSSAADLSSATTKQIKLLRPDGTSVEKDASFQTDGTDGILEYTTVSGDLSVCGVWKIQWYVVLSGGTWRTDVKTFKVYDNL
jgi:hypothetical protein